jgi:hypothetical protein
MMILNRIAIGRLNPVSGITLDDDVKLYRNAVLSDGGEIPNINTLNNFVLKLKEHNRMSNVRLLNVPAFGLKQNAGFVSKVYDFLDSTKDMLQPVGSSQPQLGSGELGELPYIDLDGVDDFLGCVNEVKEGSGETTVILFLNMRDLAGSTSSAYMASYSTLIGIRTYRQVNTFPEIRFQSILINGGAGSMEFLPATGNINSVQYNTWYAVAFSGPYQRINNMLYKNTLTTTVGALPSFGIGMGNQTAFAKAAYAGIMILDAKIPTKELDDYLRVFNEASGEAFYPQFDTYDTPIFDGIDPTLVKGVFWAKRLVPEYSGNCCRIKLVTAGTEHDIPFTSSDLMAPVDVAMIATLATGDTWQLVTYYNQNGSSDHLTFVSGTRASGTLAGGDNSDQFAFTPSSTRMEFTTDIVATDTFRIFSAFKGSTAGVLYRSGVATLSFASKIVTTAFYSNKRIGATQYGKTLTPTNNRQRSLASLVRVLMTGNDANTPASADVVLNHSGEIAITTNATNNESDVAGVITWFDGASVDWANEMHGIVILKTAEKDLEILQRLTADVQIDK